jgi:hypothetical protein
MLFVTVSLIGQKQTESEFTHQDMHLKSVTSLNYYSLNIL